MPSADQPQRRAGPVQSVATTGAIRAAALQELAEKGVTGLSVDAVARRASVGKAAIYRRWPSKHEMVLSIAVEVSTNPLLFPDTGTFEGDLRGWLENVEASLRHPQVSRIVPDLLAEAARDTAFGAALHERVGVVRRRLAGAMIERAVERGELPGHVDAELAADLIVAPVYWRLAVTRQPFDACDRERLLAMTLAALRVPV